MKIDYKNTPREIWYDKTGMKHYIPKGTCVLCKHCTDIFLDPLRNNKIYSCVCSLGKDLEKIPCDYFVKDEDAESEVL